MGIREFDLKQDYDAALAMQVKGAARNDYLKLALYRLSRSKIHVLGGASAMMCWTQP